ncbi:MAG: hypothetical protein HZA54_05550 [Planctomycetes bacterium]|nr:hypothetical protein [Planctomycetota bacterium]
MTAHPIGCVLRALWLMFGPAVFGIVALTVVADNRPMGCAADYICLVVAGLVMAARVAEHRLGGDTADTPFGPAPGRFLAIFGGGAVLLLAAAHVLASALN